MYYKDDKLETTCTIKNARIEYVIDLEGQHKQTNDNKKPFTWEKTARGETIEELFYDLCEKLQGYEDVEFNIKTKKRNVTPKEIVEWLNQKAEEFTKDILKQIETEEFNTEE